MRHRPSPDCRRRQAVYGRWHGVPVSVDSVVRRGLRRGLVNIAYAGNLPHEAIAAGLHGNQNDGWFEQVDPAEIEDVTIEETKFPTFSRIDMEGSHAPSVG